MFFEPLPVGEEAAADRLPKWPPWAGPPPLEAGAVLAVEQTVARSAHAVVRLPVIRAFRPGCMLDVEVVGRQDGLSEDDWWDLHTAAHGGFHRPRGGPLPDRLLRLGVRYADGSKATTIGQLPRRAQAADDPPAGPVLCWSPGSSGMHGRHLGFSGFGLWLWPLPPVEKFEFAVEWPFAGIELTITELDGAAIVAAASRSARSALQAQARRRPSRCRRRNSRRCRSHRDMADGRQRWRIPPTACPRDWRRHSPRRDCE
jgi:hypothetical protein